MVVHLWREVIRLRLPVLPDQTGVFVAVMHVMGQGAHVVEELRVHRPAAMLLPDAFADDAAPVFVDGIAEENLLRPPAVLHHHEAQPLMRRGERAVVCGSGRGEPAFVKAAACAAEGVVVVGVELDAASGNAIETRNPGGGEAQDAAALFESERDE